MLEVGPQIHRTEVDGVPTRWAEVPGQFTASLMFRVGIADEQLARRGVTHLVEHLAMPAHTRRHFTCNAFVEETRTMFWASGTEEEVVTFLAETTERLSSLPVERLEAERGILRTEEEARRASAYRILLIEYFGARGFGLDAYAEYGVPGATAEELMDWAAHWFTAANATLWLTGPPPPGLRLELPGGERRPTPTPEPVPTRPAACYWGAGGGLTVGALLPRSLGANTTGWVFSDRVHHKLRYDLGVSYSSASNYDRWTAGDAFVTVWPDVQEGREQEALEAMLGTLDAIAEDGPTEDELEHVRSGVRRTAADPTQTGVYLDTDSFDELVGGAVLSREELIAMQDALTAEEVANMAGSLRDAAVWVVPEAVRMPEGGPGPTSTSSQLRVKGTIYRRRGKGLRRRSPASLILSDEGATLELAGGQVITVRFADCEALLAWGDGDRELIGRDGFRLWLVPSEWKRADEILARLDAGVDPDRRVERSTS